MKLTMTRRIYSDQPQNWQGQHFLKCTHSLNSKSKIHYLMYCNVLKAMPDGRLKIKVYGERYRSIAGEKIRYVDADQVESTASWLSRKDKPC
jgi:hypothetical protein